MSYFEEKLITAAEDGDISTVRKLLRKKISVTKTDLYGRTAICAASKGHSEIVKLLLGSNNECVNQKIGLSVTPLHLAARNHQTEAVKHLVLAGASLSARNDNDLTPLHMCNYGTDTRIVIKNAINGDTPEITDVSEVPIIPTYAIPVEKKEKKSTGKKKKVKGKKKGGKSGKKKGKKKKKKK